MYYHNKFYNRILESNEVRHEIGPEKINILNAMNVAIPVQTTNIQQKITKIIFDIA